MAATTPLPDETTPQARPLGAGGVRIPFEDLPGLMPHEPWVRSDPRQLTMSDKLEAAMAGFQLQHSLGSMLAGPEGPDSYPDTGHRPDMMALEKEGYPSIYFVNVRSEEHERYLRAKIDAERERRNIARQSGWGFVGEMFGALSDPFLVAATAATGGTASIGRLVATEVVATAMTEATLQATQYERTMMESAVNIAASGIVVGTLGYAAKNVREGWVESKSRALARDSMKVLSGGRIDPAVGEALVDDYLKKNSVGAMRAGTSMEGEGLVGGKAIEKITVGPVGRLLQSSSGKARELATRIADPSFFQGKHLGRGTPGGEVQGSKISAEAVHRDDMARVDRAIDKQSELYKAYLKRNNVGLVERAKGRFAPQTNFLNAEQFGQAVAHAMRSGDQHVIPEVQEAARFWRSHAMSDVFERAVRTGELQDDYSHAMDSMFRTYEKRFDADTMRYTKGIDSLTEAYFKAFQSGADVAKPAKTMAKPYRDKVRKKIEEYVEEHGFEALMKPAEARKLIKEIDKLTEGRLVKPDRGSPMEARVAAREQDMAAFRAEVDAAFTKLRQEVDQLVDGLDRDLPWAPGMPALRPGARLTRDQFEAAMDGVWRGTYTSTDATQLERLTGAKIAWQKKQARAQKSAGGSQVDFNSIGLPTRGLIYLDTADSYFPRIVDDAQMDRDPNGLREAIEKHLVGQKVDPTTASQAAEDIVMAYRTKGRKELPEGVRVVGEAGVAQARTVKIPDSVLSPWMVNDPANAVRNWSRSLGMRAHFVEEFGDRELNEVINEVWDEHAERWRTMIDQGASAEAARKVLRKQWDQDIEDLLALRDRLVGHFGRAQGAEKALEKAFEHVRWYNMLAMLGGAALSSVTDLTRPIQAYGLRPFAKGLGQILRVMPRDTKNLKDLGIGLVWAHNSRFAMLSDVDLTQLSGVQRWLGSMFLNASLITSWDTFAQRLAGYSALAAMERYTANWAKVPAKQKARLARAGIGDREAAEIAQMFAQHGPDVDMWPANAETKRLLRLAVQRDVDWIAFKPGIGDQPLLMSGPTGQTILQFKQFVINAHNRMMVSGLQLRDRNFYMGFVTSAALGMMIADVKSRLRGKGSAAREEQGGALGLAVEGLGRAGWYGLFEPFKDLTITAAGWTPSKFSSQTISGAVVGPTPGQIERVLGVVTAGLSPDQDITYRQVAPLVPLSNMAHLRDISERVAGVE